MTDGRPALIIANGDLPPAPVVHALVKETLGRSGLIVCADGGARHSMALGIRPGVIIGDLDSLPSAARRAFPGTPVIRDPGQESTDLEKALLLCTASKCSSAVVIGAVGDRIDHSTGALGCIRKFGRKLALRVLDRSGELRLLGRDERITVTPGETFSLIPLTRCRGIVLKGAAYPLAGESLELGVREGISNRATGRTLHIRHTSGTLILYRLRPGPSAGNHAPKGGHPLRPSSGRAR
jgi:thiamine pyrophosphokinase